MNIFRKKNTLYPVFFLLSSIIASANDGENNLKNVYMKNVGASEVTSFTLEAFEEKKLGKLDMRLSNGNFVYSFGVEGAIDSDSKEGTFADLDGLKNGSKVTFGIEFWNTDDKGLASFSINNAKNCQSLVEKQNELISDLKQCRKQYISEAQAYQNSEIFLAEKCETFTDELDKLPRACSDTVAYESQTEEEKNKLFDLSSHVFAVKVNVGSNKLKWVDDVTLKSSNDVKESYSLETVYSYISNKYQRLNVGLRYEDYWKSQTSQTICVPITQISGAQSCSESPLGIPENKIGKIAFIEFERYIGSSDNFAIAPKISHDFELDVTGIDIPFYLYQESKTKGLQGGVRLGWRSDKKDMVVSVFFSKPFSIAD